MWGRASSLPHWRNTMMKMTDDAKRKLVKAVEEGLGKKLDGVEFEIKGGAVEPSRRGVFGGLSVSTVKHVTVEAHLICDGKRIFSFGNFTLEVGSSFTVLGLDRDLVFDFTKV